MKVVLVYSFPFPWSHRRRFKSAGSGVGMGIIQLKEVGLDLALVSFLNLLFMKVPSACILWGQVFNYWMHTITSLSIKGNLYLIWLLVKIFKSVLFTKLCTLFLSIVTLHIFWFVLWRHCYIHDRNFICFTPPHCDKICNYEISKFLKEFTF